MLFDLKFIKKGKLIVTMSLKRIQCRRVSIALCQEYLYYHSPATKTYLIYDQKYWVLSLILPCLAIKKKTKFYVADYYLNILFLPVSLEGKITPEVVDHRTIGFREESKMSEESVRAY